MAWYLFGAKTYQPITLDSLALAWKLHKQAGCTASCIHTIHVKNNNVIGFKCECGYNYTQKRLLTQRINPQIKNTIKTKISPKITNILETKNTLKTMNLEYTHIRKI